MKEAIGSTGRGGGAAAARRIMGRLGPEDATKLARDFEELVPFVKPVQPRLQRAYSLGQRVLLEGTQGCHLSLYHGPYPYVTARDTNVAGGLSEAGISPARVNISLDTGNTASVIKKTFRFVPEPGSLLLIGSGVVGLMLIARRKMQS